jgi:hypothetical protein
MLVHSTGGRGRKTFVILLLLLVATAISARTVHFHSSTETASAATRCTLCEVAPVILPVLTITTFSIARPVQAVEGDELQAGLQSPPEGSNLSVRPPPPSALN